MKNLAFFNQNYRIMEFSVKIKSNMKLPSTEVGVNLLDRIRESYPDISLDRVAGSVDSRTFGDFNTVYLTIPEHLARASGKFMVNNTLKITITGDSELGGVLNEFFSLVARDRGGAGMISLGWEFDVELFAKWWTEKGFPTEVDMRS